MKRNAINLLVLVAIGVLSFSCTNKELEKRVATLEGQVAELKAEKGGARPAATTAIPEPEVKPEGPLPAIEFNEELHDFGTIKDGAIVEHVFKFKNTGDAPLIISSATASCGCTVPEWPKEPIAAGEEGEIQVRFDSKNKPGVQNKTVTITANTYPKINRLRIKANVTKEADPS